MKKMMKKWMCLLAVGLLLPGTALWAQESDAKTGKTTVGYDTLRMTWRAEAGQVQSFNFIANGDFSLHWGDGDTTLVLATDTTCTVKHVYAQDGEYDVALCGGPKIPGIAALEASMVYVEGGTFQMGCPYCSKDNELPVHEVTLDGFYIGAYEVTLSQWYAVMGTNPSYFTGDNRPVENVSWNDAVEFCEKLSEMTGKTYRLPTEAEWEYAERKGDRNNEGCYVWIKAYSDNRTHPVGQTRPNDLGLYDMIGNVWEWCSDWYQSDYYSVSPSVNPQGPSSGSCRVERGGGYRTESTSGGVYFCFRASVRGNLAPDSRYGDLGFRVVREP